jgi:hypothetical protein
LRAEADGGSGHPAIAIGYNAEPKARDLRSKRNPLGQIMRYGQG